MGCATWRRGEALAVLAPVAVPDVGGKHAHLRAKRQRTLRRRPLADRHEAHWRPGRRKRNDFFNTDGEPAGGYNLYLRWQTDDVVDTEKAWEMTVVLLDAAPRPECKVDLTPR